MRKQSLPEFNEQNPQNSYGPEVTKNIRPVPQSDLDFNLMTINTEWGSTTIPEELKEKLSKRFYVRDQTGKVATDETGKPYVNKEALWELLGFYTRDMRLGNLSNTELNYCQYYLDLANDDLRMDYIDAFLICLSRVATVLELSQSKRGFLRKIIQTFIQKRTDTLVEPKKKSFLGLGKNKQEE